ncbi:MAG: tRNA-intron lyase [Candidatus Bathyarchaeota archaeon]|nr:MAG: tRNA-intron lyase [Candidatus Bathyarchaeota archaeon]
MSDNKANTTRASVLKTIGVIMESGVRIAEKSSIDQLSQRGYGMAENDVLTLAFYEALYLLDKGLLEVEDENTKEVDFQGLLQCYEKTNENAWVNYLVYRDLRSRGYVVREGFGAGIDFRIYERGAYGKDTASYLVLGTQEGKPLPVNDLAATLRQCQSQKKELILAVMNRRGEIVYYSVSSLQF